MNYVLTELFRPTHTIQDLGASLNRMHPRNRRKKYSRRQGFTCNGFWFRARGRNPRIGRLEVYQVVERLEGSDRILAVGTADECREYKRSIQQGRKGLRVCKVPKGVAS